jgi:hypothetical protein
MSTRHSMPGYVSARHFVLPSRSTAPGLPSLTATCPWVASGMTGRCSETSCVVDPGKERAHLAPSRPLQQLIFCLCRRHAGSTCVLARACTSLKSRCQVSDMPRLLQPHPPGARTAPPQAALGVVCEPAGDEARKLSVKGHASHAGRTMLRVCILMRICDGDLHQWCVPLPCKPPSFFPVCCIRGPCLPYGVQDP